MSPRSRLRWLWLGLWLAIAVLLAGRAAGRPPTRGVILDHLEFGRRLVHGEDVYGPWKSDPDAPMRPLHAPYPPSFGLLTAPFALVDELLGLRAARFAWALLQVAALAACGLVLRSLLAPRAPPARLLDDTRWQLLWLGTFVLLARFLLRDTHGGGGNLINAAFAVLALHASERGHDRRAGLWLAVSLVTKPNLVWLLPVFALFGRWRTLLWTGAFGGAALLATVALQRFDVAPWWRWLQGSWAMTVQPDPWAVPAFDFPPFEWMNQALRFALARWFGTVPDEFVQRVAWGVTPGLGLPADRVASAVRLGTLLLLGVLCWAAFRLRRNAAARPWLVAATLVLSLLLSPISWKGHHVALLPVVLLLLHRAVGQRARGAWWLLGGWYTSCALLGGDLVGDDCDEWLNSIYVVTLGDLALFAAALCGARSATLEHEDPAAFDRPLQ
ncbi:MAG: DUF2029 domain-containing protein [Planctomycetes bacterium]|nr:DUF2029 domain-containing protein [Planctomycetota bacterium]